MQSKLGKTIQTNIILTLSLRLHAFHCVHIKTFIVNFFQHSIIIMSIKVHIKIILIMSDNNSRLPETSTWLDRFLTELIFESFDCLSSNDVSYFEISTGNFREYFYWKYYADFNQIKNFRHH
jgi:hypothetical protein